VGEGKLGLGLGLRFFLAFEQAGWTLCRYVVVVSCGMTKSREKQHDSVKRAGAEEQEET